MTKSQGFKKLIGAAPIKEVIESGEYVTMTNGEHIFRIEATIINGKTVLTMTKNKVVYYQLPRVPLPRKPIPLPRVRSSK